jgi:hypothetical protein
MKWCDIKDAGPPHSSHLVFLEGLRIVIAKKVDLQTIQVVYISF